MSEGYEKGDICNRNLEEGVCLGIIDEYETDASCSCHINPPCNHCVDSRAYCATCGWDGAEEQKDYTPKITADSGDLWEAMRNASREREEALRDQRKGLIPSTKIDWISESHTHFSMKKIGVFPIGTTTEALRKEVNGTFGGRFTELNFEKGLFTFIAYTD